MYPSKWKIDYSQICEYLTENTGIPAETREPFFKHFKHSIDKIAIEFTASRVFDIFSVACSEVHESYPLVNIEKEFLVEDKTVYGVLYDAGRVTKFMRKMMPKEELLMCVHHIVFLDRLIGTYSGDRYHARMVHCSVPSVISPLGIIQGPARPREFYEMRNANPQIPEEILIEEFKALVITYDDERITEVAKALALQAVLWGNGFMPFCEKPDCRLYNPHWQEEMVRAMVEGKFCRKHLKILREIKNRQKQK